MNKNKFLNAIKWIFAFTKKASLKVLQYSDLSEEEFEELKKTYQLQVIKRTKLSFEISENELPKLD